MKTDALIAMLARGPVAAEPGTTERRLAAATALAALVIAALGLVVLGPRPDLASAAGLPAFWLKLAFPVALACAAYVASCRLARPGARLGAAGWGGMALPFVAVAGLALAALIEAPSASEAWSLVSGRSAVGCFAAIALLALPVFAATQVALRSLGPTRLRAAGAVAGLLAGAVAAAVYAIHCDEMAAPFVAVWYGLGMAGPTVAGAWLGPRLLRWERRRRLPAATAGLRDGVERHPGGARERLKPPSHHHRARAAPGPGHLLVESEAAQPAVSFRSARGVHDSPPPPVFGAPRNRRLVGSCLPAR